MVIMSLGLGAVFVGIQTAANAGVPPDKAGLAAALINTSRQLGAALDLAIFSAIASSHTTNLLTAHASRPEALTSARATLIRCLMPPRFDVAGWRRGEGGWGITYAVRGPLTSSNQARVAGCH
jgi:hypothetical protein